MDHLFPVQYSWLIPLAPLVGAIIAGFFGAKWLKQQSHWPIWIGVGFSAALSLCLITQMWPIAQSTAHDRSLVSVTNWYTWIQSGTFKADAGALIDPLTAIMLTVVTGIGFLITVFSKGYMKGESGYFRFFAYLGLFIFAMTMLVMGNNLIMLYLGWEGVGLCSYLLIGYYYEKPAAVAAAKKAFIVNRIGDFGFSIGIMLSFLAFGTVQFFSGTIDHSGLLERVTNSGLSDFQETAKYWIPFCLMIGAFGKSAQFPLYVWLPDAMEGPTPVSALIHAATMVTAGVYMIARCSTLFVANSAALWTIAIIGAFTAIFAATIALRQFDLKKVFAYSTISQLGFMFVAVGVLAPVAGVFYLITHAFFKALLFLSSGVVMHAMSGELDMRKMSGLKRVLPKTRWFMLIGCLALAGMVPFSGFWSKDEIIAAALDRSIILGAVMIFTAFLTSYYTFRLYFRVFEGPEVVPAAPAATHDHGHGHKETPKPTSEHEADDRAMIRALTLNLPETKPEHAHDTDHNHEPLSMMLPLAILAIGAVVAGFINFPNEHLADFLGKSPSFKDGFELASVAYRSHGVEEARFGQATKPGEIHTAVMVLSFLVSLLGIVIAYAVHLKDRPAAERLAKRFPQITRILDGKYWVDEIYQAMIVEPLRMLGQVLFAIDRFVIDGVVWAISFVPQLSGFALKLTTQRGYLQGYAVTMLLGIAIILAIVFLM